MKTKVHAAAAASAFLIILAFWSSTLVSELFGSHDAVVWVKSTVLSGMAVLIPALMVTALTGRSLAGGSQHPTIVRKARRMPFIAANGLLVLVPSALVLATWAAAGEFSGRFYALQALELLAGAVNLTLLGLNARDGLGLTRPRKAAAV